MNFLFLGLMVQSMNFYWSLNLLFKPYENKYMIKLVSARLSSKSIKIEKLPATKFFVWSSFQDFPSCLIFYVVVQKKFLHLTKLLFSSYKGIMPFGEISLFVLLMGAKSYHETINSFEMQKIYFINMS